MIDEWKILKSEKLLGLNIFDVVRRYYQRPDNKKKIYAHILELPNWVNIVGIDEENRILLIKQFRFGNNRIELEIPGGIIEKEETPKEAAIRELKEETGYTVKTIKSIGTVDANPAFMNNKCFTFLAELSTKGCTNFDPNEIIELEFATPSQVKQYLHGNIISNAYCVIGLFWYFFSEEFGPSVNTMGEIRTPKK
ncbi:MAG: hypothetical protein BAJALOKI1v1_2450003 [Promethearchaeota archaeon]|nr:MAG: hypothetical protein BAJALOKI1v1_2450003 [Candidatus Lokiarchaeota archaeon]